MRREVLALVARKLRAYRHLQSAPDTGARLWCEAIRQTLQEYEHTGEPQKARLLKLRYFEGKTEDEVRGMIFVSRNTYYGWKNDVLGTVAFYAAMRGLFVKR